jgi:hypothetical protein
MKSTENGAGKSPNSELIGHDLISDGIGEKQNSGTEKRKVDGWMEKARKSEVDRLVYLALALLCCGCNSLAKLPPLENNNSRGDLMEK